MNEKLKRELKILKGMTQSNRMVGDKDGWHFYCCDEHKVGPILTFELLSLGEKGLTTRYEGVDRMLVSDKGIKRLQEEGLWPLGPFSDPLPNMLLDHASNSQGVPKSNT